MSAAMALFAVLALAMLALPLHILLRVLKATPANAHTPAAGHRAVLQAQWVQLNDDLLQGRLDATEHARTRDELMLRLLEDEAAALGPLPARQAPGTPGSTWALLCGLPLLVLAVYSYTGSPQAVNWRATEGNDDMGRAEMRDVEEMIEQMAQRLRASSNQPHREAAQAWALVAQSYAGLQRFADAEAAYARASELEPRQAQWLADRADMLAMANNPRSEGEPERLVAAALRLDPNHLKALALAGSMAYQRQDMVTALDHWRRARALITDGSGFAGELDRSIAAAQTAVRKQAATATPEAVSTAAAGISGTVRLSPTLAHSVLPTDSVFVLVRAVNGPRAPLAVTRHTVADLPLRFELNDSQAMTPELKLSHFERVEVLVRVSRRGDAMPRSGDLFAQSGAMAPHSQGLQLVIDQQVP